ncbi:BTAD domain-containing putative transcriptional regulator [Streptomyces sp. NPDC001604]|uniref:AfsR/SARP family transcriptional regulator n=1 Tax=Streptomyces sp. NPDC001604 TaxID=3364593 RepID=UPI00368EE653
MDIQVLGALGVREGGVSITPTAPKARQVLALLALHADQVVPVSALVKELWAERPPRSARTTLQTYVLQLRELITAALAQNAAGHAAGDAAGEAAGEAAGGVSAKDVLVTCPGGYRLETRGGSSDVREFERLAGLGYRAMDAGDHPRAARLLREALGLFSGTPFADVQAGSQLDIESRRLKESRLCALDQRIEADLRLGRHRELLAELTVLVSQYATHENLHAQFMLALQRSGRRSEALEVYRRLRTTLVRELGIEPSVALRRLQRSILLAGPEQAAGTPDQAPRLAPAAG